MVEAKKSVKKDDTEKKIEKKEAVKKETKPKKVDGFAVIKTGGKQYIVTPGDKLRVEKLEIEDGKNIKFEEVLLKKTDDKLEIGTPFIKDVSVTAKVLTQLKDKKIIVFKYKKRKNYRRKQGHRQNLTEIEITSI